MDRACLLTSYTHFGKSSAFVSHLIIEVAGVLGITLKHATAKHDEKIGQLERTHVSIKQALKI